MGSVAEDPNGTHGPIDVPDNWIPVENTVLWEPFQKLRIISIGAGFSGQ